MTRADRLAAVWRRFVCRWRGHTFRIPDGIYTGSIGVVTMLNGTDCRRCGEDFAALWNKGEIR